MEYGEIVIYFNAFYVYLLGQGGILPFLMTIASQFGASPALIGIIYSTLPFFSMVAKPSFGFLADQIQLKKAIFLSCIVLMTSSYFSIYFIPSNPKVKLSSSLVCHNISSSVEMCNYSEESPTNDSYGMFRCNSTCNFSPESQIFQQLCNHASHSCPSENATQSVLLAFQVNSNDAKPSGECVSYALENLELQNQYVEVPSCANVTRISCKTECDNGYGVSNIEETNVFYINNQIMHLWILMIFGNMFMSTATSMGDTLVLGLIPHYNVFGRQRLFGSIGFGLFSIVTGLLVDVFSNFDPENLNFTPALMVVLILGIIDVLIASRIPDAKTDKPKHLIRNVCGLFRNAEILLFMSAVFFVGYFSGILWTFLIVYLNGLGATQLLIGLMIGVQCFLGEIPFMFVSKWFLKKLGHGHSMTLVLAVFGIRFLLYYFITDPWMVLPIEVTNGICFGIFFTALATYGSIIAPPSSQATVQGILQAVFEGLGAGTGCLLSGLFYQSLGGKMMWLVMGSASCVLSILYGLLLVIIKRRAGRSSDLSKNVPNEVEEAKEVEMSRMLPVVANSENNVDNHVHE